MYLIAYLAALIVPLILRIVSRRHIYWSALIVPILIVISMYMEITDRVGIGIVLIFALNQTFVTIGIATIFNKIPSKE